MYVCARDLPDATSLTKCCHLQLICRVRCISLSVYHPVLARKPLRTKITFAMIADLAPIRQRSRPHYSLPRSPCPCLCVARRFILVQRATRVIMLFTALTRSPRERCVTMLSLCRPSVICFFHERDFFHCALSLQKIEFARAVNIYIATTLQMLSTIYNGINFAKRPVCVATLETK